MAAPKTGRMADRRTVSGSAARSPGRPRALGRLALALSLVILVAGCGPAHRRLPSGSSLQTLSIDGRRRSYHLYRPASLPPNASDLALVVVLHGGFGTGAQAESAYGWDEQADRHHFVVTYPDGIDRAWSVGGGCCGRPADEGVDDAGFIEAMVAAISRDLPIDPGRVFATGISNGGLLAYRLGCDTGILAAIGPVAATLLGDCPAPHRLSIIHVHGTADHNIPYPGGTGDGFARIDGPPVPALIARWRRVDGCGPATQTTSGAVSTSRAMCPQGRTVELITIAGAGHQWPGAPNRPVLQRVLHLDPPSSALDATDAIWTFFAAHPRAAAG